MGSGDGFGRRGLLGGCFGWGRRGGRLLGWFLRWGGGCRERGRGRWG